MKNHWLFHLKNDSERIFDSRVLFKAHKHEITEYRVIVI